MNDMALKYAQHRFTVAEYHRMDDAGVFAPDSHIELIDGEVVERLVSMKPSHASVVATLDELLRTIVAGRALIRCQLPITLGDFSEPEPDFAIVRGHPSLFKTRHPYAEDLVALIEVSDTSRDFDLRRKVPIYAEFGIPEVWIVDLIDACIHTFCDPVGGKYRGVSIATSDDRVELGAFSGICVRLNELLE